MDYDGRSSYVSGMVGSSGSPNMFGSSNGGSGSGTPRSHDSQHNQNGNGYFGGRNGEVNNGQRRISIESTAEWQINDIAFDGQERYLQPLEFSDHVAKLAHKVNWSELIGDVTSRDEPESLKEESEQQKQDTSKKPGHAPVGPWDTVAKKLQSSLTEMNVLLDLVKISEGEVYLRLEPAFGYEYEKEMRSHYPMPSPGSIDPMKDNQMQQDAEFKSQTVTGKRMALHKASGVLEELRERLSSSSASSSSQAGTSGEGEGGRFLEELRVMRENYRLKKVGNTILGDLGYRSYGKKFRVNGTFEVERIPEGKRKGKSTLDVTIPKDLEKKLSLVIYIEKDSSEQHDMPVSLAIQKELEKRKPPEFTYSWQKKLYHAQQTLLTRDIFMQLAQEAVNLEGRVGLVRENILTLSLGMGYLLQIRLITHEDADDMDSNVEKMETDCEEEKNAKKYGKDNNIFSSGKNWIRARTMEEGLRRMYSNELGKEECRFLPPMSFPILPTAQHPPSSSVQQQFDGPYARTLAQSEEKSGIKRRKSFLQRLVEEGSHFLILSRILSVLKQFTKECLEPQLTWHFVETGSTWTVIKAQIMTIHYEYAGKSHFMLEINTKGADLITKEGERTELSLEPQILLNALWIQCKQQELQGLNQIVTKSPGGWHLTLFNLHAIGTDGVITPTLLASSSRGHKTVCIRLPVRRNPEILVQEMKEGAFSSDLVVSSQWKKLPDKFKQIDYGELQGFSFFNKVELLLTALAS